MKLCNDWQVLTYQAHEQQRPLAPLFLESFCGGARCDFMLESKAFTNFKGLLWCPVIISKCSSIRSWWEAASWIRANSSWNIYIPHPLDTHYQLSIKTLLSRSIRGSRRSLLVNQGDVHYPRMACSASSPHPLRFSFGLSIPSQMSQGTYMNDCNSLHHTTKDCNALCWASLCFFILFRVVDILKFGSYFHVFIYVLSLFPFWCGCKVYQCWIQFLCVCLSFLCAHRYDIYSGTLTLSSEGSSFSFCQSLLLSRAFVSLSRTLCARVPAFRSLCSNWVVCEKEKRLAHNQNRTNLT